MPIRHNESREAALLSLRLGNVQWQTEAGPVGNTRVGLVTKERKVQEGSNSLPRVQLMEAWIAGQPRYRSSGCEEPDDVRKNARLTTTFPWIITL
jgi:hypothetical protein